MPQKGKSKITESQRLEIAAAKVAGHPHKKIAEKTGLAVNTIDHQVSDPRTATHILRLKHKSEPQIDRIWGKTLNRIEADIHHKELARSATARGQFIRILTAGDPPLLRIAPADNSGGDFTLEELLISYRRVSVASH